MRGADTSLELSVLLAGMFDLLLFDIFPGNLNRNRSSYKKDCSQANNCGQIWRFQLAYTYLLRMDL